MSKPALALATRDVLCEQMGFRAGVDCEHMPDGRPMPRAGGVFVAVHYSGSSNGQHESLDRRFGVSVTVSCRLQGPPDRAGPWLLLRETRDGLEDLCDEVVHLLHMSYGVMNAANAYLAARPWRRLAQKPVVYGFSEPCAFQGDGGDPRPADAHWWYATPTAQRPHAEAPEGYSQTLRFGGARRTESVASLRSTP